MSPPRTDSPDVGRNPGLRTSDSPQTFTEHDQPSPAVKDPGPPVDQQQPSSLEGHDSNYSGSTHGPRHSTPLRRVAFSVSNIESLPTTNLHSSPSSSTESSIGGQDRERLTDIVAETPPPRGDTPFPHGATPSASGSSEGNRGDFGNASGLPQTLFSQLTCFFFQSSLRTCATRIRQSLA